MPVIPDYYELFICAACETRQRFYVGDIDDITKDDVDGVRCYRCGVVELLVDEETLRYMYGDNREECVRITKGEPTQPSQS